ncbi:hypothetical protein N0V90_011294 [Kalmusia sp. IMI 367209]|nr:hypothetical protein N0V90_011294 [Kalmusia sp. IMI 367209]
MNRQFYALPSRLCLGRPSYNHTSRRSNLRNFSRSRKWDIGDIPGRKRSIIASEKTKLWREKPSDLEANLVIGITGSMAVSGVLAALYLSFFAVGLILPAGYAEDLRDVLDDDGDIVLVTTPGVLKRNDSCYRKLLDRTDIRFLILHPGQFDDEINFDMKHISLSASHLKYEALSYAWGNEVASHPIYISDTKVLVTSNLHSALRYLRFEEHSRRLWIDALCIDQNDIEERRQQVRLMGDVFSEADRVIIWLGEQSPETTKIFSLMNSLHQDQWLSSTEWLFQRDTMGREDFWSRDLANRSLRRSISPHLTNLHIIDWNSIQSFLQRPWFHRLWVVQEVSHAKRVVVVCGDSTIPWSTLSSGFSYLEDQGLTSKHLEEDCALACKNNINMERIRSQKLCDPLFTVVLTNTYGKCSDPRDKIFAMMSISDGQDILDWEISFDYSLTTAELFKRFAIWDII